MAETAEHGFTSEQMAWLEWRFSTLQRIDRSLDRATIMWIIGGLTALGVAVSGVLYSEIGSVRDELRAEIGSVRDELRDEMGSLRDQVQANTAALARIEAILNERLPRNR